MRLPVRTGPAPGASHGLDHAPRSPLDRRATPRFRIVGRLGGRIELVERMQVQDVSRVGIAVRTGVALTLGSTHDARLVLGGVVLDVSVRVARIRPIGGPGGDRPQFQLGLEFVGLSSAVSEEIDRFLAQAPPQRPTMRPG
jgi:hypothetical protein